jgi:site-specific DNA recombinase
MFVSYSRRSTHSQSISVERQETEIISVAKRHGVEISHAYVEEPITGSAPIAARPVLSQMLDLLEAGDTLIVASPSRLARSQMVYQTIVALLHQKKVNIIFADGTELDLNDSVSILLGNIMSFVSEYERKAIAHRTKQSLALIKDKKALGRPDLVKYGWRADSDGNLILHAAEQNILRLMKDYRESGMTQLRIAESLNESGYRNRQGRVWNQPRVSQVLGNIRRLLPAQK